MGFKEMTVERFVFGPPLIKIELSQDFTEKAYAIAQRTNEKKANQFLVGDIKEEYYLRNEDAEVVMDGIYPELHNFIQWWHSELEKNPLYNTDLPRYDLELQSLWCNLQKAGEYNPLHNHAGDISFVFYPHIPDELALETTEINSLIPGAINFHYADKQSNSLVNDLGLDLTPIDCHTHLPKTGELFVFPSWLKHSVFAFKTPNITRWSIAGNVFIRKA